MSGKALPRWLGRFIAEFKRVAKILLEHPGIGTPRSKGRLFFRMRVFPYGLIYRQLDSGIHVLVVRRDRRHPNFGRNRK